MNLTYIRNSAQYRNAWVDFLKTKEFHYFCTLTFIDRNTSRAQAEAMLKTWWRKTNRKLYGGASATVQLQFFAVLEGTEIYNPHWHLLVRQPTRSLRRPTSNDVCRTIEHTWQSLNKAGFCNEAEPIREHDAACGYIAKEIGGPDSPFYTWGL